MGARPRGRRAHAFGYLGSRTANDPQHVAGDFESLIGRRLKEEGHRSQVVLRVRCGNTGTQPELGRVQRLRHARKQSPEGAGPHVLETTYGLPIRKQPRGLSKAVKISDALSHRFIKLDTMYIMLNI